MTEEKEYSLGTSAKGLGKLTPILKDAHGNIIDGFHRQNEDPDWESIAVESVDTPQKLELARLAVNFCRRTIGSNELKNRIAFLVGKCGMRPEEISELTGISKTTIYKYLPEEFKDKSRIEQTREAGLSSAKSRSQTNESVKTQDTNQPFLETPIVCANCGIATRLYPEQFTTIEEKTYCLDCAKNHKSLPKSQPKIVEAPKAKDRWEHRVAQMKVQTSNMEQSIRLALQEKGLSYETDVEFCLQRTIPDLFFRDKNLAVYLDGAVHKGREDRDEALRELLAKRHSVRVLSISYDGNSQKAQDAVLKQILEAI